MARWLAISNRANWDVVRKKHVWGVPRRNKNIIARVNAGDTVLIYVSQEKKDDDILPSSVVGEFVVTSEAYEDHTTIFTVPPHMVKEDFPYRITLSPVRTFDPPVEFKPLIPQLGFITNKKMWTGHIRVAMRTIPEEDYQLITSVQR